MATGKKGSSAPAGEQKQKKPAYEVHIDKTFDVRARVFARWQA